MQGLIDTAQPVVYLTCMGMQNALLKGSPISGSHIVQALLLPVNLGKSLDSATKQEYKCMHIPLYQSADRHQFAEAYSKVYIAFRVRVRVISTSVIG